MARYRVSTDYRVWLAYLLLPLLLLCSTFASQRPDRVGDTDVVAVDGAALLPFKPGAGDPPLAALMPYFYNASTVAP
eukprot:CAMPEP_0198362670 /NCGR_PEP_ID=MMETSP1450-20131203/146910_1 /TAXON_ID=753684 ORGANISM="Madagascaria erythrocladiodes, Strain CCMP3234" /NCGR_SAMPLE_ID=MMETSP1450 /ASSEMBLY_ACC=CAM_ASM_001115 /LENGTH=76 /DNA_ID=CAMNT_0044069915 /DNA_START=30 /DNA_END=257 /DNA_ORIENTATION=+